MFLIGLVAIILVLVLAYVKNVYNYWEKKGIITPPFQYFFGNLKDTLTLKRSIGQIHTDIYEQFEGYNYAAFYKFMGRGIVIRNPDIIKEILQTSFSSFRDNDIDIDEKNDLVFGKNPFALKGDKWKKVRAQVSPSFSANKVKLMFPLVLENCKKMKKYIERAPEARNETALELKELASKYTSENVASCAFGIEGGVFENPKSDFREIGRQITEPTFFKGIKQLCVFVFPSLAALLRIKFFTDEATDFLKKIVAETLNYRKSKNIVRNDFLEAMSVLRNKINDESEFNIDDIVAHAGGFFADGFETSSIVISYALYELAANPDVQETLYQEIVETLSKYNGEITFEAIQEMPYLECIFKENLRLHVPLLSMIKTCNKTFQLPPMRENEYKSSELQVIEPGTQVVIPVYGLHMDKKYFDDPTRFIPERFGDENKNNINKYTYLPFGEGPRMCLGQQFGILQSKLCLISIVKYFSLKVNKKTKEPLVLNPTYFMSAPIGGMWMNFYKRN